MCLINEREFVQLMGRIRRGEARDKDYDRLNKVGAKKHADDAEPTVRARRLIVRLCLTLPHKLRAGNLAHERQGQRRQ